MTGKNCGNCNIDVSPVWRQARDLGMTLCNACHIFWSTNKVHRPIPSPEAMARIITAARDRKAAPVRVPAAVSVMAGKNSVGGKRKRTAKNWGKDQHCYGEGCIGRSDSSDSMDSGFSEDTHAAGFDATPPEAPMDLFGAAQVLVSLKRAKYSHRSSSEENGLPSARSSKRRGAKRDSSTAELTASNDEKPLKRSKVVVKKICKNCGVTETPIWRRARNVFPLCNACGVAMRAKGVNRVSPKAMAAASAPPLNSAISIVPAAPAVSDLPPVPALQLPVKKPVARALPADFFPLRVESPTPMRIPVPSRASCRGKSLFGGPCKQFAL